MPVNNPFALVAGLQYVDGTPSSATSFTGTVAMGFNGTDLVGLRMDASDNLLVNVAAFSGTVAVTQSTTPWIVAGNLTHNSAAPTTNNVGVLPAVASSGAPTYNTGDQVLLSTDLAGNLRVSVASVVASNNITEWASTLLGIPTVWGTAPATSDVVIGANAELFVGQNAVSATNPVPISATAAANASGNPIFVETVSGSTTAVTGTVAVTQSTSPWVVSLTSTTITGTVAVTQSTSPWVVNLTQVAGTTLGATAITNFGTAPAAAAVPGVNASLFAGTTGITATGSSLNVDVTNTVPVTLTSTTITGTVAVTQSTSPWVVAGGKTNNNAAPGATNVGVLPGIANAATQTWTEGDQVLESMDLSGRQRVRGTLTHNNAAPAADQLSVIPALANAATPTFTEGDQVLLSTDLSGNIRAIEKKDTGRTYVIWHIDAVAGVTTEALVSLQVNKGGTLQTAGTTYTVTAGKTLRLQSFSCSVQETNSNVQWLKARIRSAAAVTASSPVITGVLVASSDGNTNGTGYADQSFPDGLEIAAGQQVGISQVTGTTSTNVTMTLVGYEY